MQRAYFPIIYSASPAVIRNLGPDLTLAVRLALRAILKHGRSLEVAHQQIRFKGCDVAFSSRVTGLGDLIIELDIGDARLSDRIVLEDEFRRAESKARLVRGQR